MKSLFEVNDENELLALYRVIVEGKFNEDPEDTVISGSPFVANAVNRIADKFIELKPHDSEWREIDENHRFVSIVKKRVSECSKWNEWPKNERIEYLNILLSPFRVNEHVLQKLTKHKNV